MQGPQIAETRSHFPRTETGPIFRHAFHLVPVTRNLVVNQRCSHVDSDDKGLPYVRMLLSASAVHSEKRLDCISRSHALKRAVAALSYAPKEESHFGSYLDLSVYL